MDAQRACIPQAVPAGARASLLRARSEGEAPDCSKDGSNESRSPSSNSPGHSPASRRRSICQARFLKAYARVGIIGVAAEMAGISLVGLEKSGRLGTRSGPSESSPVWRPRTIGRLQKFHMPNTAHSLRTSRGVTEDQAHEHLANLPETYSLKSGTESSG